MRACEEEALEKARLEAPLDHADLVALLGLSDSEAVDALFECAYEIKARYVGRVAYFRGIVECSNFCTKDCLYCGIRRSNTRVERFEMDEAEIVREALWAFEAKYGSCVIQSGERSDPAWVEKIERVVRKIKEETDNQLGITLSLGEQTEETYRRWREAGAHRYLLRIETSSPSLYQAFHPDDHSFELRVECLHRLRRTGWQVGTGVMMGLPGQTLEDLADDLFFFREMDIDMIGMGPYIPHADTPLGQQSGSYSESQKREAFLLGLKMIAVARLFLKDVNIAAATALQALDPAGREKGLRAGANVIMPNLTDTSLRPKYQLYDGKPCLDENSTMCRGCLERRIQGIGETIGWNHWGDAPHYQHRIHKNTPLSMEEGGSA